MDNMMPNLCGPAAAKEIRSLGYGNLLIGVTGNAMEVDVVEYEAAGADAVLVKPVKIEQLIRLIDYCQRFGYHSPVWHVSSVSVFVAVAIIGSERATAVVVIAVV